MPVRSSLCTYSPTATTGASSTNKYSSILPITSSLSYGNYKPLRSNNYSPTPYRTNYNGSTSLAPDSLATGARRGNRYGLSSSQSSYSPTANSSFPHSSTSLNASNSSTTSLFSSSGSNGLYRPLDSSARSSFTSGSPHNKASPTSSRYAVGDSPTYGVKSLASSAYSSGCSLSSVSSTTSSSFSSTSSPITAAYGSPNNSSYAPSTRRLSHTSFSTGSSTKSVSSPGSSLTGSSSPPPPPAGVPRGLVNLGNTCYMNASLQSLYSIESLRSLILSPRAPTDKPLTRELADLFKLMKASSTSPSSISPANFKYAFSHYQSKFSGFGQQDAQEFLRYLINGIHEEANLANQRRRAGFRLASSTVPASCKEAWLQYREIVDDSPLVELLVGQLCSTITCSQCQNKSHCWDPFWDLSLPLSSSASSAPTSSAAAVSLSHSASHAQSGAASRHTRRQQCTLRDALEEFTAKETLDSDERPICSHCKRATKSTKQISLARLPEVLILHLKKFTNDGYKLTSPEIRIDKQLAFNGITYQLKACISHHGHSSCSGHYTSHCEYAQRWFHFNDDRVREVTHQFDGDRLEDAYVLFYMRHQSARSRRPSISQSKL